MSSIRVALTGNPNSGKTTLFNSLTGARQKVGNWPGVTIEKKHGYFQYEQQTVEIIDLPGTYNLSILHKQISLDEKIAIEFLLSEKVDIVLNIIDATNLERNLFLTMQLIELGLPVVIALNMMDLAKKKGIHIDIEKLSTTFKCPVVPISASKKIGLNDLRKSITQIQQKPSSMPIIQNIFPQQIEQAISTLTAAWENSKETLAKRDFYYLSVHLLENDQFALNHANAEILDLNKKLQTQIESELKDEADIIIADHRYQFINQLIQQAMQRKENRRSSITHRIDKIVLNRYMGIPIFLFVMYCMFLFAINIGGAFQDFFDLTSDTIFVQGLSHLLHTWHWPNWLIALLSAGIGKGINTTITFIPVIGAMFLFLSFLESSGYMTRAAFVVDRLMQAIGLPGKSFVPLIVGFGCNVPAIMATRTLENRRDRILTIIMSPFMSCGARLAIYAVFTAAFFPKGGQNIVFSLYLIGILMAILTGFILRKTLLKGEPSPLIMEMPNYHLPSLKNMMLQTWHRLNKFLFKAGKMIIPVCILIGTLNAVNMDGSINTGGNDQNSILATIGKEITPIFSPMGIQTNNWPATVGLLTGTLAKEVVVASLNTLYTQAAHLKNTQATDDFSFWPDLKDAVQSIPDNLSSLDSSLGNPITASAPEQKLSHQVYGEMYKLFGGQLAAYAYLLFVLLYFPCVSATAAVLRELNRAWTFFAVAWTTGLAYGMATLFYQTVTFIKHPASSLAWIIIIVGLFTSVVFGMRYYAQRAGK